MHTHPTQQGATQSRFFPPFFYGGLIIAMLLGSISMKIKLIIIQLSALSL